MTKKESQASFSLLGGQWGLGNAKIFNIENYNVHSSEKNLEPIFVKKWLIHIRKRSNELSNVIF